MVEAGFRKPNNGVVLDPKGNAHVHHAEIKTVANMYPGRLVQRDTTDDGVKVSTSAWSAQGFLGYEHAAAAYKPTTRDTIYAVNDRAPIISGHGFYVRAVLADNQTIVKGDRLGSNDSSGCLTKSNANTGTLDASGSIGVAMESVTTSGDVAAIWVEV